MPPQLPTERIQKVLARIGLASRRAIEQWIREERITVNGKHAQIGQRIRATDRICVDGKRIVIEDEATQTRVLIYHKPVGEICTRSDPEGRTTVFESLPRLKAGRWLSIGRLDINTSGLILFTNEGELANRLMHPSSSIEREYAVRVHGLVTNEVVRRLTSGVQLDDGKGRFEDVVDSGGRGSNHWFHVVVMEGRNRFVRRLWESQGVEVSRLIRVRFGPIVLDRSVRLGHYRELKAEELDQLLVL